MSIALAVALVVGSEGRAEPAYDAPEAIDRHAALGTLRDPRAEPRFDDLESPTTLSPRGLAPEMLTESRPSRGLDCGADSLSISSYDNDPFVESSIVECLDASSFERDRHGRLLLLNRWVAMAEEQVIFRLDDEEDRYVPFAFNPWPCVALERSGCAPHRSSAYGDFFFPGEERFPLFERKLHPDGSPVLLDGLQVWLPRDLHHGFTTAFEAANSARRAAQVWAGRDLRWGADGRLPINTHAFVGFNAFYSPAARGIFFGVVPYRLPGSPEIRMFEVATSWEIAAHEAGHALHAELKPNKIGTDRGYRTWTESFSDQIAMWTALRDPERVRALLAETDGEVILLRSPNSLTSIGEVFAALVGEGTGLRDAAHNKRVSTTSDEEHDRSEVLTGAAYVFFFLVYDELAREQGPGERALRTAGTILGTFLTRAADYTPENTIPLEDVAKAYLKVDKELFGGHYHTRLVEEFLRRELFDADSVTEWLAHEAEVPDLELPPRTARFAIDQMVQANLDVLGIGPSFGLRLQSVTRDRRLRQTIVRVQLTEGRGAGAVPLNNHGILTFRANGALADYHAPLPSEASEGEVLALLDEARRLGLDQHGVPLAVVRKPDGHLTAQAEVMRGRASTATSRRSRSINHAGSGGRCWRC